MQLFDQNAAMQVLGCLMKKPLIFAEVDKYRFELSDFENKLYKKIYAAIRNLYTNGAKSITPIDIDSYLQTNDSNYKDFIDSKGVEFLNDMFELSNVDNYDYNYNIVKKLSALRELKQNNYDISFFTGNDELDIVKQQRKQLEFDSMSVDDIFQHYAFTLNSLSNKYLIKNNSDSGTMADGLEELVEKLKESPEIGYPLQGDIFNSITMGARIKKFYLLSGSTGSGKSRKLIGHACGLAYPIRYDCPTKSWINTNIERKVLFIATELEKEEVQTITLAYVSGVNESKILNGGPYSEEEITRITLATEIIEQHKNNLRFERIADPNISQLKALIRKHKMQNYVQYVFYDYIFSSPALLNEFRDLKVREDVALMLLSTALKDLAVELNLFIMSGTQLNGEYKDLKGLRDQSVIRGSKAIIDKIDVGAVSLPVTTEELKILDTFIKSKGFIRPTHVTDIYKLRRGRYNHVRIWSVTDLGVAQTKDLFATDVEYNIINLEIDFFDFEKNDDFNEVTGISNSTIETPNIEEVSNTAEKNTSNTIVDDYGGDLSLLL